MSIMFEGEKVYLNGGIVPSLGSSEITIDSPDCHFRFDSPEVSGSFKINVIKERLWMLFVKDCPLKTKKKRARKKWAKRYLGWY